MADYGLYRKTYCCKNKKCISTVLKENSICKSCSLGKKIRKVLKNPDSYTDRELASTFFTISDRL